MKFETAPDVAEYVKKEIYPDGLEYVPLRENRVIVKVAPGDLTKVAELFVKKFEARLIHATAVDLELKGFEVLHIYDFSKFKDRLVVIVKAIVDKDSPEFPSIANITWQATWAEREMKELLGVKPSGMPDPRHQFLPHEWPNPVESGSIPEGYKFDGSTTAKEMYLPLRMPIEEAYQTLIPIGPYHPGVIEGQIVYVKVEGEQVVAADIKTGFHHRGIMKLIERRGYNKGAFLAERVCGICSAAHGLAYITCTENLYESEVPERALYIRTLLAELNRMHSHLLWVGVVADVIGWKTGFMLTWGLRERVMDIIEAITGNRVNYGIWRMGGVSRDVPQELAEKAKRTVDALREECAKLLLLVADHPVVKSRLIGVGPLTRAQAYDGGAVGPVARASDWKIDVRIDNPPHAIYDPKVISWEVITDDHCDTFGRTLVRVKELLVSCSIVSQCLEYLAKTTGDIRIKPKTVPLGAEAVGLNEAPRGELAYYIRASDKDSSLPHTVRIRTPSYRNNAIIPLMLVGSNLADVPVVMGSTDQCLACTDRLEVIDNRDGGRKILTWDQLVNLSRRASRW
ncbi:MAG: NADH-quinone oxidoreductase subunit C [Candidatus Methanosuratincola sp.]|uniref:Iron hydrogenase n=2 Tax=Candidatus Methanosuratincola (ex Vanwonterghem et al. 2016) TaxID=1915412 RepID=A0A444L973_METS7|nr:MAG: iron hydrogenase [Candidatus Methanosuratincola subterraneus]